jgi:two-component system, NarL family, invasion response regulator UvrY
MSAAFRIMVVDDHKEFRAATAALVSALPGFEMVAEAATGEEALALLGTVEANVVLMDVRMPGIGGIEATRRIRADYPSTRVVLVSSSDLANLPAGVVSCGADRFVRKDLMGVDTFEELRATGSD